MRGKVKKFLDHKGYGFIEVDKEDEDVFFHYSEIVGYGYKTVAEGQEVEFNMEENEHGKYARHIIKL